MLHRLHSSFDQKKWKNSIFEAISDYKERYGATVERLRRIFLDFSLARCIALHKNRYSIE